MILHIDAPSTGRYRALILNMHRTRKAVFVDRLGWNIPVVDNEFEIDQFDNEDAIYLINGDPDTGHHLASVRLLPSTGPHVLGDLFPDLCEDDPPCDDATWEITRLCVSFGLDKEVALKARQKLAVGLVEFALLHGIERYTCVIETQHIPALIAPGWVTRPLGAPKTIDGLTLGAFEMAIGEQTLALMAARWGGPTPVLSFPEQKAA